MHSYSAYGLSIRSALQLPELNTHEVASATTGSQADVVIRFGRVEGIRAKENGAGRSLYSTPEGIHLYWRGIGAFLVRDGREIIIDPASGVEERVLRIFTLGTTLAMLLHQRGDIVVMHASAVAISGHAVAFVGAKHAGKSTIAATLHQRGHDLVADDILAIESKRNRSLALPGFPHLKLWPDSVTLLDHLPETLPQLVPQLDKRGYRVANGFSSVSTPLKCVYALCFGEELCIETLQPREALIELMPHWYGARFGKQLLQSLGLANHFLQCVNLSNSVTICRLNRPHSLSALPDAAQLVEAHLNALANQAAELSAS